jgi:hypothetical protein
MRHGVRSVVTVVALVIPGLSSCKFQDLTPGGSRRDEAAMQGVVASFYQAMATRNVTTLGRTSLPAATALIAPEKGPAVLVPVRAMIDVPERRNQNGGARITHTELHVDGDIASDRIVVVGHSADNRREYEASDLVTLAHRAGSWRVAHVALGPWRTRSAP